MKHVNPYANQWRQFEANTCGHQLKVLHDDGLYKHLRMAQPGTSIWSWNLVTWPGYMTVVGDIGDGFTWHRELDMIAWADTWPRYGDFYGDGSPYLQADYWAEKLTRACRGRALVYDVAVLERLVAHHGREQRWPEPVVAETVEAAHAAGVDGEAFAHEWLRDAGPFRDVDTWEWDLKQLDHHYLLACYAMATTIRAYRHQEVSDRG